MMAQLIDRKHLKQEMKELLRSAQVSPRGMTCLYLALVLVLNLADSFMGLMNPGLLGTFISILTGLMSMVLASGFVMYCMAIRRGERAEYLTLFDGFSFVGKVILLNIVIYLFTFFWSLLFVIPGIIAAYRYRFALYNLYENPGIGVMEALNMSKAQTAGFKGTLFVLDLSFLGWSILCWLTLGILSIWIAPYKEQANVGYFQEIKKVKGIGYQPPQDGGEDDEFRPIDPFGPSY